MSVLSALPMLLSVIGALSLGDSSGLGVAAATAVALMAIAIAIVSVSATATTTGAAGSRRPHPRRSISPSTLLAQSDPDAPGSRRPRAPGLVASAA
ncbi:DUF6412 domain-containing protein [Microbacterium sp. 2P01SA-2]|uniref:DUF6412 domain-containing protein n=1 Tax=unclassified Microbacterium TaxID=2609290 RepID=UPI0039A3208E